MTGAVGTMYRFKLAMFLGPIRRQPGVAIALGVLAIIVLPSAFGFGFLLPDLPIATGGFTELAALTLSVFAAFFLISAPGGGILLQPAEVDFVAPGPVTVRQFARADLLFQATLFGFGLPLVALFALGYTVRVGASPLAFLVPLLSLAALLFIMIAFVQALRVARLVGRRWALPVKALGAAVLLAPAALAFLLRIPVPYASVPFPTTAAVYTALLPFGGGGWPGPALLAAYGAAAVGAHAWATRRPAIPNLKATFGLDFGPEGKRRQQEALFRAFGRFRRTGGSRLYRPTVVATMASLHFARMARDGSLVLSLALAAVFTVPFLGFGPAFSGLGAAYIALILAIVSVAQWMASDRTNLWIVLVSGSDPGAFFVGWWAALGGFIAAVAAGAAVLGGLLSASVDAVAIAAAAASGFGGAAGAVIAAARFPYAPNEFSLRPFLHFLIAGAGAGVGALAAVAVGTAASSFPALRVFALAAVVAVVTVLSRATVFRGAHHPRAG